MSSELPVGKIGIMLVLAIMLVVATHALYSHHFNHKTRVVFCDVGQGDGVYMRINNRIDILVDAGPERAMNRCLGKYMPFYDRTIEFGFVSHPQLDHYGGFIDLMQRYTVNTLFINIPPDTTTEIDSFIKLAHEHDVKIAPFLKGDMLRVGDALLESKWPTKDSIDKSTSDVDPNDLSQVIRFSQRSISILLTGDVTPKSDKSLLRQSGFRSTIIKIPHHGSANALTRDIVPLADPRIAVISVGRKNRYKHPSSAILNYLESEGIKVLRTDEMKDISFSF